MTPVEVLQKVHVRYEKNTDYPEVGSEDHTVRLAYLDDALTNVEIEIKNGLRPLSQITKASFTATGTGTEDLSTEVDDFLDFARIQGMPLFLMQDSATWQEVSPEEGKDYEIRGLEPNVFWLEGTNLRTLPAITGTVEFPYYKEITRYPLGSETTEIVYPNPFFCIEYILAMLYLDDGEINQYNAHINTAKEILTSDRTQGIIGTQSGSNFGFGM